MVDWMQQPISDFWGKLTPTPRGLEWHPWIDHCADVGAVCEALLRLRLVRQRLASLGGRGDLTESAIQRLSALVALHDAGKANQGFQNKAYPNRHPRAGHVQPIVDVLFAQGSIEQRRLREVLEIDEIQTWAEDGTGTELLLAAICHHGRPVEPGAGPDVRLWRTHGGLDPFDGIKRLSTKIREWFPAAFEANAEELPSTPEFAHAFCGLVTLADWIGSDRTTFRFTEPGDPDRLELAREKARTVLRRIGIDAAAVRAAYRAQRRSFIEIFGFAPHLAQRRMMDSSINEGGGFVILESETGSGKTEAALTRFFRLFEAGLVDGMYFALPTRTAAVQMHRRIVDAVERAFPTHSPPVILAVPGYLAPDETPDPCRLAGFDALWPDNGQDRYRRWAAENPKRFLAGAISVGTVDQVLLSALMVSHSHLRATPLLRQFLVVDEVHASDTYMTAILGQVLRFHLDAGGQAILLSATLGSRAAVELISASQHIPRKLPPRVEAESRDYPLLTSVSGGQTEREALISELPPKTVVVELTPVAADFAAVAARALEAAKAGARVLIVRNTVRDCIATQIELERIVGVLGVAHLLFAVDDHPAPHHARFARPDRILLDCRLEERFGKTSTTPCVAAATQTVQQSLDLDADLMITELAPMDVMLQRIGRLHRHSRNRPEQFRAAWVIVLTPANRDLSALIGRHGVARGPHGLGTVYEDLRVLEATWRTLEAMPVLEIPAMNRRLVEAVTHPDALSEIAVGPRWKQHAQAIDGQTIAARGLAALNCVKREEPFSECRFPSSLEARIRTRLGEDDRIVDLPGHVGPFGATFDRLTIPGWLVRGASAEAQVQDIAVGSGSVRFSFGGRAFIYDRLGLRPFETLDAEDDLADA
jgi:CRISPR-associated endonuclease/helicase Cas3